MYCGTDTTPTVPLNYETAIVLLMSDKADKQGKLGGLETVLGK
jgi:hypothetical protein